MSFVSSSARTVTVNDANYSNNNSDNTTAESNNNNDNTIANGSATPVVLRLEAAVMIVGGGGVRPRLRPGCRCGAAAAFGGESLRGRQPGPTLPAARLMSPHRCPRSLRSHEVRKAGRICEVGRKGIENIKD